MIPHATPAGEQPRRWWLALWLLGLGLCVLVLAKTDLRADLSIFLPRHPSRDQQLLIEQLQSGAANRVLLLGIEGAEPAALARLGPQLAQQLAQQPGVAYVHHGQQAAERLVGELVFKHRYLLSPAVTAEHFSVAGLRQAIQGSLDELSSSVGLASKALLTQDPTGETQALLENAWSSQRPIVRQGQWFSPDGQRALMLVLLAGVGTDTNAQEQVVTHTRRVFEQLRQQEPDTSQARLLLSGGPVFAISARQTISEEVGRLSVCSAVLIVLLLWWLLRSPRQIMLALLPMASGVLAAVATVSLVFGHVHGLTIGFGTTLMGEAVDYAIYYFLFRAGAEHQPGHGSGLHRDLWRTVRLGLVTSLCGFGALLFSGFPGMQQLGVFSMAGLLVAAAVTRWVLPQLSSTSTSRRIEARTGQAIQSGLDSLRRWRMGVLALGMAAMGYSAWHFDQLWNHSLGGLSPVPQAMQDLDASLRADLGAADIRHILVIKAAESELALQRCEQLLPLLDQAQEQQLIGGYQAPCRWLPSQQSQQQRRDALPESHLLRARLQQALQGLPLNAASLEPFISALQAARNQPDITRSDWSATPLSIALDVSLMTTPHDSTVLVQLQAPRGIQGPMAVDGAALRQALAPVLNHDTVLLDIKNASNQLYQGYMSSTLWYSALGLVVIVLLLVVTLRRMDRVLRVLLPLLSAMAVTLALLHLLGLQLTLLHLVGLLLIFAVGSNYALFFNTPTEAAVSRQDLLLGLLCANLTTVMGFGILMLASTPVLAALGQTVGPGTLLSLLFSAALAPAPSAQPEAPGGLQNRSP